MTILAVKVRKLTCLQKKREELPAEKIGPNYGLPSDVV
jgi:hypothetical protein